MDTILEFTTPPSYHFIPGKRLFTEDGTSSNGVTSPMSEPRRYNDLANRGEDDDNDYSDEDIVMKPKSLAATFDCFSDSDNE